MKKSDFFFSNPVNVGSGVAPKSITISTDISNTHMISKNDDDVGYLLGMSS
ncbi:MAG TPA: hypothetical protein VLA71_14310 [Algoriphagus sp.]|nr:hypothetical protein [Algoriphagus sp.]